MKWIALSSEHHLRNRCMWVYSKHNGSNGTQEVVIKGPHNKKYKKSNVTCQNCTAIQLQQCHVLMIHCDSVKASSRRVAYIYIYIYSCCSLYGGNNKLLSTHPHAHAHTHAHTHTHTCAHTHTHTCAHTHTHTHAQTKTQQQQTRNMKFLLFDDKCYQLQLDNSLTISAWQLLLMSATITHINKQSLNQCSYFSLMGG